MMLFLSQELWFLVQSVSISAILILWRYSAAPFSVVRDLYVPCTPTPLVECAFRVLKGEYFPFSPGLLTQSVQLSLTGTLP